MMEINQIYLAGLLLVFAVVGAMVDTYTSHRYFPIKREPPAWLANFMPVWWLVVYTAILPFLMVWVASGFASWVIKVFVTMGILASVVWDLVFSKVWSGKWISDSTTTWFWVKWKRKIFNVGFSERAIGYFHALRLAIFIALIYWWWMI